MSFRQEIREWINTTCPESIKGSEPTGGGTKVKMTDDQRRWLDACAERGEVGGHLAANAPRPAGDDRDAIGQVVQRVELVSVHGFSWSIRRAARCVCP